MKKMRIAIVALLCVVMAVGLAACGSSSSDTTTAAASGETSADTSSDSSASAGGTINVMLSTNVMSLDSNLATDGESFEVIADCIDGLTQMDSEGAAVPAIAESWDVSEDGCTYTFHLVDNAVWSNGTKVTAADFEYAWKLAMTANVEYNYMYGSDVGAVKNADDILAGDKDPSELGVTAIDETTLEVQLEVPVSFFPSLMYFPAFYPINQEFYESLEDGMYGTSPDTFLSNGAFKLSEYTPGTASIKVVKNPDYYDADRVKLDGINYQVVGSSDNALTGFKSGTLDIAVVSGDQVASVKEDADLSQNLEVTGAGYMWYLTFSQTENNAEGGALANENLRLAISNCLDREALVENYVMDGSIATYTAVPPQFATNANTGEDFSADQDMFKDVCSYDTEKAVEYFEKAKEELGKDTFNFTICFGNNEGDEVTKVAQAIKEAIEGTLSGITITLAPMTKAERLDKMQNDNYDIALTRWGPDYADPMTYLGMWVTDNANNYGFWSNEEYDTIIKNCTSGDYVSDYDQRWEALYDAETLVMNEAVIAPLYTKSNANLIASKVSGVDFHPVALNRVYKDATVSE